LSIEKLSKHKAEYEISKDGGMNDKVPVVGGSGKDLADQMSDPRIYELDTEEEEY
jgi:hypothetical protein